MQELTKRLNNLVKAQVVIALLFYCGEAAAQQPALSLEEAYRLSEKNYPAIKQKDLIRITEDLSIQNLSTGFLPQFSLNGQASYQSDVTEINVPISGIKIPSQSKDQYKATADVNQLIFDGGLIKEQKQLQKQSSLVEESRVEIEMYTLRDRINQLYFSILYQDELLKQTDLLLKDVQVGINKIKPQVENGVMLRSNLLVLQAQALQTEQRVIEIKNTCKGLLEALSLFVNQDLKDNIQLALPQPLLLSDTVSRPELKLYEEQSKLLVSQQKIVDARNLPRASVFVQGGYGKPGLNLLSNEFDVYYISGLRLNWSLGSLYTKRREKQLLHVNRQTINLQKETFLLNTRTQLKQQKATIEKFAELVQSDQAIIELRSKITEAAKAQLENAVITANDYLREVNAEDAARQALATHKLQLIQAQINYGLIAGTL